MMNVASISGLEIDEVGKTGLRVRAQIQIQRDFAFHLVTDEKVLFTVAVPVGDTRYGVAVGGIAWQEPDPAILEWLRRAQLNWLRQG
jgi:hypothetical protein